MYYIQHHVLPLTKLLQNMTLIIWLTEYALDNLKATEILGQITGYSIFHTLGLVLKCFKQLIFSRYYPCLNRSICVIVFPSTGYIQMNQRLQYKRTLTH